MAFSWGAPLGWECAQGWSAGGATRRRLGQGSGEGQARNQVRGQLYVEGRDPVVSVVLAGAAALRQGPGCGGEGAAVAAGVRVWKQQESGSETSCRSGVGRGRSTSTGTSRSRSRSSKGMAIKQSKQGKDDCLWRAGAVHGGQVVRVWVRRERRSGQMQKLPYAHSVDGAGDAEVALRPVCGAASGWTGACELGCV